MSFYFNGTLISNFYFNGVKIDNFYFNGTKVYSSAVTTVKPNIVDYSFVNNFFTDQLKWRVKNLDGSTATIKTEAQDSTPDKYSASVSSNGYTTYYTEDYPAGSYSSRTIYATAQASGEVKSSVDAQTVYL